MGFLLLYSIICWLLMGSVVSIYDDNFAFTFKEVNRVHTVKSDVLKFEIELLLSFNTEMTAKEFFLTALIPAKNLRVLAFQREDDKAVQENVEIRLNKEAAGEKDPCDYLITSKMYLLKLSSEELKKFKIYRYPFANKEKPPPVPPQYEYSEESLKNFFPSEGTIYPSNYFLKISVEVAKGGFSSDGIWIFALAEKNNTRTGNQECTIYSNELAEVFLPMATHNDLFLLYCNSATNAELLNLVPDLRKSFDVKIFATKAFYGAEGVKYTIQMSLGEIAAALKLGRNLRRRFLRSHQVVIHLKMPPDLCYANSCFSTNKEDPCRNVKAGHFEQCAYTFRNYEFVLKSSEGQVVQDQVEVLLENINHPLINLESDKNWTINLLTVDSSNFAISQEHKEILQRVSNDVCSKKFIQKFVNVHADIVTWMNSHLAVVPTPKLTPLVVEPTDQHGLLEDPLLVQLKLRFPETHLFSKCTVELKTIHSFASVTSRSEHRLDRYNMKLMLPNSAFKPVHYDQHRLYVQKKAIRNNDLVRFALNVTKYNSRDYWRITIGCLNSENKYIREAQALFTYPIENKKMFLSDLYFGEKLANNTYLFYLNVFLFDEKEVEIKLSLQDGSTPLVARPPTAIQTKDKTHLTDTCDAYVHTSCYDLVYHECSKEHQTILYKINSYRSTNKHFTVLFPLVIPEGEKKFTLQITVETKKNAKRVQKDIHVDIDHIVSHNGKAPCVNNLITTLRKYQSYESHLFLLFRAVNCYRVYEPFLINHHKSEGFHAKTDSSQYGDKFTFQKTYRQTFPVNYESVSQLIFDHHLISVITIILIDDAFFLNSRIPNGETEIVKFFKKKILSLPYNKYYLVNYSNQNVLISMYTYVDVEEVKIDIVQKSSDIQHVVAALDKAISFAEYVKSKETHYMHTEYSILLLTDMEGMDTVRAATSQYVKNENDVEKNFSRIYVLSFEKGEDFSNNDILNESIQNVQHMYTYNTKKTDHIFFTSFHNYTVDEELMVHYAKAALQDYLLLHTQIYKTAWYLIGICRYNVVKNSPPTRKLHLFYVDKNVKTVTYSISADEAKSVLDNSSADSYQDMCNIFTQLQLLGHR
ncbi:hypothetical protein PCYB_114700 [Plasmodium cynomolgi strain B]|uniref:VWFA domain-containing protein n=1 Tax=Plasmodium cynomolgi (strain B) TaxID=1120755 RepID=K6UY28_PLACD|nr:hypothetical protein PCYB_114700 [Plasmodium cynomolgi strain B]GAB67450.1 hypothetical protein PCYB_114700 [Plasmodium cynomolgi strain B]